MYLIIMNWLDRQPIQNPFLHRFFHFSVSSIHYASTTHIKINFQGGILTLILFSIPLVFYQSYLRSTNAFLIGLLTPALIGWHK